MCKATGTFRMASFSGTWLPERPRFKAAGVGVVDARTADMVRRSVDAWRSRGRTPTYEHREDP